MIKNSSLPLRRDSSSLIVKDVAGELMVFDPTRKKTFCLNKSAAIVWQNADGNTSVEQIAALVAAETGTPQDVRVVEFALRKLEQEGLMEAANLAASDDASLGRRQLFTKLGWAAALMVAAPLVLTVTAPRAVASVPEPPTPPNLG